MKTKTLKRLRNFVIYGEERNDMTYIGITTVNGDWKLEYRFDSVMYMMLKEVLDNEEALDSFCTVMFAVTYSMHSVDTYRDIVAAIQKEIKDAGIPEIASEDDEVMLSNAAEVERLAEEINNG